MILSRATCADLEDVLGLLNGAAERLHGRGISQWPCPFGAGRIGPLIARGEVLLAREEDVPVVTGAVSADGDPDFWSPCELAEPASYVSKVARADGFPGAGEWLLRWITDAAAERGDTWVRLDAWRTNPRLHAYYAARRWYHLRTEDVPGRNSGALFQRLALPDPQARAWLQGDVRLPASPPLPVRVVLPPAEMSVTGSRSDHGVG